MSHDSDFTNQDRAVFAALGLQTYAEQKEGRDDYDPVSDMAADMIADLLHLVTREGGNPETVTERALNNWRIEHLEESGNVGPGGQSYSVELWAEGRKPKTHDAGEALKQLQTPLPSCQEAMRVLKDITEGMEKALRVPADKLKKPCVSGEYQQPCKWPGPDSASESPAKETPRLEISESNGPVWVTDFESYCRADVAFTNAFARRVQEESPKPDPKKTPVCAECGSADVSLEAFVTWDSEAGKPVAGDLCDKGHTCPNCGECSLDWVDPKPEGLDLQHMIEEAKYLAAYLDGEDSPGAREAAEYLEKYMHDITEQYQVFRAFVEQIARLQSYNLSGDIPGETVADAMTTINHFQAKANEVLAGYEPPVGW